MSSYIEASIRMILAVISVLRTKVGRKHYLLVCSIRAESMASMWRLTWSMLPSRDVPYRETSPIAMQFDIMKYINCHGGGGRKRTMSVPKNVLKPWKASVR
jgi:hypothetical protein